MEWNSTCLHQVALNQKHTFQNILRLADVEGGQHSDSHFIKHRHTFLCTQQLA